MQWVRDFAAAGASMFTFHLEAAAGGDAALAAAAAAAGGAGIPAVHDLIGAVKAAGMLCGVTIKPGTPVELLLPYVPSVDMVRQRILVIKFLACLRCFAVAKCMRRAAHSCRACQQGWWQRGSSLALATTVGGSSQLRALAWPDTAVKSCF